MAVKTIRYLRHWFVWNFWPDNNLSVIGYGGRGRSKSDVMNDLVWLKLKQTPVGPYKYLDFLYRCNNYREARYNLSLIEKWRLGRRSYGR